jgi:hypothetical protein
VGIAGVGVGAGAVFHPNIFEIVPVTEPNSEEARETTPGVVGE